MEKFDKIKYNMEFRKKHKALFAVDLNKEEKLELDILLKQQNITKVAFVRNAIKDLKERIKKEGK